MDWKKNTVSMGQVDKETFDLTLATVTVSENRIVVEPKDVEDWDRIIRELGEDTVLRDVHWREVEELSTTVESLYYPHIDVRFRRQPTGPRNVNLVKERRIYFVEDEQEELERCLNTIKQFWNRWRQNQVVPRPDRREPDDEEPDEIVELEDALREQAQPQETERKQADTTEQAPVDRSERDTQTAPEQEHDQQQAAPAVSGTPDVSGERSAADEPADSGEMEDDETDEEDDEDDEIDEVVDKFLNEE